MRIRTREDLRRAYIRPPRFLCCGSLFGVSRPPIQVLALHLGFLM